MTREKMMELACGMAGRIHSSRERTRPTVAETLEDCMASIEKVCDKAGVPFEHFPPKVNPAPNVDTGGSGGGSSFGRDPWTPF